MVLELMAFSFCFSLKLPIIYLQRLLLFSANHSRVGGFSICWGVGKNNLHPSLQPSFCKSLGAYDTLLTITNCFQKALNSCCEMCMVGLDFSAVFDRVNHKAFIFKLRQLGVGGLFLSILSEFLSNNLQRVVVYVQSNEYRNVISDVPQGSIRGPLPLILYTYDNMRSFVTKSLNRDLQWEQKKKKKKSQLILGKEKMNL